MDEREIAERLAAGDKQALGELYTLYGGRALKTAYLICSDRFLAEDAVSETFITVFQNIKGLKDSERLRGWFFKILTRTAVKLSKRHSRITPSDKTEALADKGGGVSDRYFAADRFKALYAGIERLSPKLRAVIVLYYFNDMSIKDIAASLGCFEGTVKSRLFRAKKELKTSLLEGGFEYE